MVFRYLYIDDEYGRGEEGSASIRAFIRSVVGASQDISISGRAPEAFHEEINNLLGGLGSNSHVEPDQAVDKYDGLILDWRLDNMPADSKARYRAGALAQEIRTRGTESSFGGSLQPIREVPIILWSTQDKLRGSYNGDDTSHDLFDRRYDKDELAEQATDVRAELISLADGYVRINKARAGNGNALLEMLSLNEENTEHLDPRIVHHFPSAQETPVHEYARFILRELIFPAGVLISEAILAARLGIDIEASTDWSALLQSLGERTRYTGVFSDGWPRWWAATVERNWWRSFSHDIPSLSAIGAKKRVKLLQEYTGFANLVSAQPISPSYSERFTTVSIIDNKPLDVTDGFRLDGREPLPWQEPRYISRDAALVGTYREKGLRLHPLELERLYHLQESHSPNAQE